MSRATMMVPLSESAVVTGYLERVGEDVLHALVEVDRRRP